MLLAGLLFVLLAGYGPGTSECAARLKRLWNHKLEQSMALKDKMKRTYPTGSAYWLHQQPDEELEPYVCPLSGKLPAKGTTTHCGPKDQVSRAGRTDVVGACIGIHPDGSSTLLRKDGTLAVVPKGDPAVAEALAATSD